VSGALQIDSSNHNSTELLLSLEVDPFQEAEQWHSGTIGLFITRDACRRSYESMNVLWIIELSSTS